MVSAQLGGVVRHLHRMAASRHSGEWSDRELVEAFMASRDQRAFAVLVSRHGPPPGQAEGVTTDAAGRFRLTGLGRDWLVRCHIEGPSIQHTYFWAMTRPVAQPVVRLGGPDKIFGARFDYPAAAARPIRGVV